MHDQAELRSWIKNGTWVKSNWLADRDFTRICKEILRLEKKEYLTFRLRKIYLQWLKDRTENCWSRSHSISQRAMVKDDTWEFKIYDATVAKTSLKIASSSFPIYFAIMSGCLTFES